MQMKAPQRLFLTLCVCIIGTAVTTTSAAVVSQSPQLYNQTSNPPSSPVILLSCVLDMWLGTVGETVFWTNFLSYCMSWG